MGHSLRLGCLFLSCRPVCGSLEGRRRKKANCCRIQIARDESPANNDRSGTRRLSQHPWPFCHSGPAARRTPCSPRTSFFSLLFFSFPSLSSSLPGSYRSPFLLSSSFLILFSSLFSFSPVLLSTLLKLSSFSPSSILSLHKNTRPFVWQCWHRQETGHRQPSFLSPCFQSPPCLVSASTFVRSLI